MEHNHGGLLIFQGVYPAKTNMSAKQRGQDSKKHVSFGGSNPDAPGDRYIYPIDPIQIQPFMDR